MIVVVTGARGLLGSEVMRFFRLHEAAVGWSSSEHNGYRKVDVTQKRDIDRALDEDRPDVIIHCAANPNVAACEDHPEAARELNSFAVHKVASAAQVRNVSLVFVSTDYVFSGKKESGYTEEDSPDPLQVYGHTKMEGERYCLETTGGLVVRLPLLFGAGHEVPRTTFPVDVLQKLRNGEPVSADTVEIRQPTWTADVAQILYKLIEIRASGLVHVAGQQGSTKYDWAVGIAKKTGLDPSLIQPTEPSSTSRRPRRSWLLNQRLQSLRISPPRNMEEATRAFFAEMGFFDEI